MFHSSWKNEEELMKMKRFMQKNPQVFCGYSTGGILCNASQHLNMENTDMEKRIYAQKYLT